MGCVVNSGGLGQLLSDFPCPYDRVFDPGSALDQAMSVSGLPLYARGGIGEYLPAGPVIYPQFIAANGLGCGGKQDCGCGGMGALTMDGTGLLGTGLFSGGFDLSTWGIGEYLTATFGLYIVFSVFSDIGKGVSGVKRSVRRVGSFRKQQHVKKAKKASLEAKLAAL
jgi:hypothetical protein